MLMMINKDNGVPYISRLLGELYKTHVVIKKFISLIMFTSLFVGNASAVLVETDFLIAGDKQLTVDTDTGLEWLDSADSGTEGKTYNEIMSGYGGFTTTYGFRYATMQELQTLMLNAGISIASDLENLQIDYWESEAPRPTLISDDPVVYQNAANFVNMIGANWIKPEKGNHVSTQAQLAPGSLAGPNEVYHFDINATEIPTQNFDHNVQIKMLIAGGDLAYSTWGHLLVRDAVAPPVPVPAAAWLFCSALIGLVGIKRKKQGC